MKVIDIINKSNKTLFTFELLPPLRGKKIDAIYNTIDKLIEYDPSYINITFHREEIQYGKNADGSLNIKKIQRRPGTIGIASSILTKYNIPPVPHVICGSFTKEQTEGALIDLNFLGIDNILALRGDKMKNEERFVPSQNGNKYAKELVEQIVNLNKGQYLESDEPNGEPTNFSAGVAGYPEKHIEADNLEDDLKYLKEKVDAGADYIVTQMFFDNSKFFAFEKKCREIGITVPIIPGLKPISVQSQIEVLPKLFHVTIPEELSKEINKCTTKQAIWEVGVEWCTMQSKELVKAGVPVLHFYSYGEPDNVAKVARCIY